MQKRQSPWGWPYCAWYLWLNLTTSIFSNHLRCSIWPRCNRSLVRTSVLKWRSCSVDQVPSREPVQRLLRRHSRIQDGRVLTLSSLLRLSEFCPRMIGITHDRIQPAANHLVKFQFSLFKCRNFPGKILLLIPNSSSFTGVLVCGSWNNGKRSDCAWHRWINTLRPILSWHTIIFLFPVPVSLITQSWMVTSGVEFNWCRHEWMVRWCWGYTVENQPISPLFPQPYLKYAVSGWFTTVTSHWHLSLKIDDVKIYVNSFLSQDLTLFSLCWIPGE